MASQEDQHSLKQEPEPSSNNSTDQEADVKVKGSKRNRKLFVGIIVTALMLLAAVIPITITAFLRNQRQNPQSIQGQSTPNSLSSGNSTLIPITSSISTSSSNTQQTNGNINTNNSNINFSIS